VLCAECPADAEGQGIDQGSTRVRPITRGGIVFTPQPTTLEVNMSSVDVTSESPSEILAAGTVQMKLEIVLVPVSDVDRAKDFYEKLGWRLDADFPISDDYRIVQLTPPGSECSIIFGKGVTSAAPGSLEGLQLTVSDIEAARDELVERGIDVELFHDATGAFHHAGSKGRAPGPDPARADYGSFGSFSDPDGNGWLLQEVKVRAPGR
jgi:catechol 2,3-dioxygenase-like lactoylglutathione lyase family enzyme